MICSILPEACFAVNSIVVYQAAADAQQACSIKLNALVASAECTSSVFASECLYSRPRIEREHFVFNISILGHRYALLIRQHGQSRVGTYKWFFYRSPLLSPHSKHISLFSKRASRSHAVCHIRAGLSNECANRSQNETLFLLFELLNMSILLGTVVLPAQKTYA